MKKALGSFSGMRKYLEEEMLAESLRGRIRYGCTTYAGMDDCKVFEICVDGKQIKRFSHETLNTYFIENGYKSIPNPFGRMEYWHEYWYLYNDIPPKDRTEYNDEEFCGALETYRNQSIGDSIGSDDPLVWMFAILDRRVGKRTLAKLKDTLDGKPEWLRELYKLRFDAEFPKTERGIPA